MAALVGVGVTIAVLVGVGVIMAELVGVGVGVGIESVEPDLLQPARVPPTRSNERTPRQR